MSTLFIISSIGMLTGGFVIGVFFSMWMNGDFKEDLSKPNSDYD